MAGSDIEDEDEVRDYLTIYPPWPFLAFLDDQLNAIFFYFGSDFFVDSHCLRQMPKRWLTVLL